MSYRINPAAWGAIFAVPAALVDKYIRLATGEQLKVLLWLLRQAPQEPDLYRLCKELKMLPDDAEDYLRFWVEQQILTMEDTAPTASPDAPEPPAPAATPVPQPPAAQAAISPPKKELPPLPDTRPSGEQIAARCEEAPEILFLFQHAQEKLGRTVGYDGQCALLMMHDAYGLPVEVILMVLEYAVSVGKTNFHYIEALARNWGEQEIDSIEKADAQISALRGGSRLWQQFAAMAGIQNPRPTAAQMNHLQQWQTWGFAADMLFSAYEKMRNSGVEKLSFPYMNKILADWHENGIHTPQDAENYVKQKKSGGKSAPQKAKGSDASYDLEKYKQAAIHIPSAYQKNKG